MERSVKSVQVYIKELANLQLLTAYGLLCRVEGEFSKQYVAPLTPDEHQALQLLRQLENQTLLSKDTLEEAQQLLTQLFAVMRSCGFYSPSVPFVLKQAKRMGWLSAMEASVLQKLCRAGKLRVPEESRHSCPRCHEVRPLRSCRCCHQELCFICLTQRHEDETGELCSKFSRA